MDLLWLGLSLVTFLTVSFAVERLIVYSWDGKRLRKYPGLNPFCGITNLAYIFELWRGDGFRSRTLMEAHQNHKTIRLGPNSLSFADTGAIKDIYGHNTLCTKGDVYTSIAGVHRSLLDSVDRKEHAEKRKRLAAAFATKHLTGWEHKVVDKCSRLIIQFDRHCELQKSAPGSSEANRRKCTINLRKWLNLFTVEAIADIALSDNLGMIEAGHDFVITQNAKGKPEKVSFVGALQAGARVSAPIVWSQNSYPLLKQTLRILSKSFAGEVSKNSLFDAIIRRMVLRRQERQCAGEELDDFFTCLIEDRRGQATGLEMGEICAEVSVLLNAGSDTTAIQLTHVFYYLLKHPDKLRRLREELDRVIDSDDTIPTYATVRDISYLRACLDESLRLSPPVSAGLQRKTPPGGTSINNEWIAGDTLVSVPAYVAHRDPTVFPDPNSFVPERWLGEEAKEMQKFFIPFSTGARGCIGRNISYIEQHVLVAALLKRYDFALLDSQWELTWEERFNLWPGAMPLKMQRRSERTD